LTVSLDVQISFQALGHFLVPAFRATTFGVIALDRITFGGIKNVVYSAECHYAQCCSAECRGAIILHSKYKSAEENFTFK